MKSGRDAEATAGTTIPRMLWSKRPERDWTGRHVGALKLRRAEASEGLVELRGGWHGENGEARM